MKKIVCGAFGTIYDATILKDGLMSSSNRRVVTDECVDAVMQHLQSMKDFEEKKFSGYTWDRSDKKGQLVLALYDTTKYKLVPLIDTEDPQ